MPADYNACPFFRPPARFRISAYLCVGAPSEDEEVSGVNPIISEENGSGGTWCINYCQPYTASCWQTNAAGQ
jgi:hypothetical protein